MTPAGLEMENTTALVIKRRIGRALVITFNHPKRVNPISRALNLAIRAALSEANADPEIGAIVLTGGKGRSFCAGGDFNEVAAMSEKADVESWLEDVVTLYRAVLTVSKPVVCAIDGHAIGIGFQLALCADWRLASPSASLVMWELQKGVACVLGAAMLQHCFGRLLMTDIIYGCEAINGCKALELRLVNELVEPHTLIDQAVRAAERFAAYPEEPFRMTKAIVNAEMIDLLSKSLHAGKSIHTKCFEAGAASQHFDDVLSS